MTDKQIIINGVNVAECEYFNRFRNICHNKNLCCDCEKNQDCCYKQLKRKEKACEEWKEEYRAKVEELNELEEKLLHKEQECEELKAEIKHYKQIAQYHGNLSVKYTNKSARYKQTLIEIKKIAENVQSFVGNINIIEDDVFEQMEQILQKISECEVENG